MSEHSSSLYHVVCNKYIISFKQIKCEFQITELKAQHHNTTCDIRNEMKNKERLNDTKFTMMNSKIQTLLKEVATLSKSNKKNNKITKSALVTADSGSGTDSPSTN